MHPSTRRAREILERRHIAEAEHEAWRAEHDPFELEIARSDARLAELRARQLQQKRDSGELRTTETPLPVAQAPQATAMDEAALDQWFDERVNKHFEEHLDVLYEDVDIEISKVSELLRAEIKTTRDANMVLRAKLELLTELLKTKSGSVVPLRGRDVA